MTEKSDQLLSKIQGCLYGGAIGDAMGGPAEWHTPEEIRERYGYITDLVEGWDGPSDIGKGDGRYTDDTHMIQLLSRCYIEHGGHLDAHEFLRRIVPMMAHELRWVPERGQEMLLVDRLFYPEKWLYNALAGECRSAATVASAIWSIVAPPCTPRPSASSMPATRSAHISRSGRCLQRPSIQLWSRSRCGDGDLRRRSLQAGCLGQLHNRCRADGRQRRHR